MSNCRGGCGHLAPAKDHQNLGSTPDVELQPTIEYALSIPTGKTASTVTFQLFSLVFFPHSVFNAVYLECHSSAGRTLGGQLVATGIALERLRAVKGWELCVNSHQSLGECFGI